MLFMLLCGIIKLIKFGWINLHQSQAQPYGICTCVIALTQTLYMWSITQKALTQKALTPSNNYVKLEIK